MNPQEQSTGTFAAVKMPKAYLDFIKKNDKIANAVGTLMVGLAEIKQQEKEEIRILSSPELFEKELEDGTPEQLKGFLSKVLEDIDKVQVYQNITDTEHEEILEKLGKNGQVVVSTRVNLDEQTVSQKANF